MADETTTSTEDVVPGNGEPTPEETTTGPKDLEGKTFTQADLDRLIAERLKREKQKYADYGELKKQAAELEKIKEQELTESERLQKQLSEVTDQLNKSTEQTLRTMRQNAIIREAAQLDFIDPGEAYALLLNSDDITVTDGKIEGAAEAVKQLAEVKPHLIKSNEQRAYLESFNPAGKSQTQAETPEQKRARIYGQGNWGAALDNVDALGGGVVWNKKPDEQE